MILFYLFQIKPTFTREALWSDIIHLKVQSSFLFSIPHFGIVMGNGTTKSIRKYLISILLYL